MSRRGAGERASPGSGGTAQLALASTRDSARRPPVRRRSARPTVSGARVTVERRQARLGRAICPALKNINPALGPAEGGYPERVVLFGSQARGDARPGRDVDLLVVFDKVDDRRERQVQLRRLLNHQPFAKDVLVADRADIARPSPGSALAEALREGVTVYAR